MNALLAGPWLWFGIGGLLVLAGRRLVWLAVAAAGFVLGAWGSTVVAPRLEQAEWIVAMVMGLAGAVVAVVLQRLAIAVAGAGLGALMALHWAGSLTELLGLPSEEVGVLVAMAIGGALGLVLASKVFALAASLVTAAIGAVLIATHLPLAPLLQLIFAMVLLLVGLVVQLDSRERRRAQPAESG